MEAFFAKVKTIFKDYHCEHDVDDNTNDETINFRHLVYNSYLIKFDLKVFMEKLNKLVEETPQLVQRIYIAIHYQAIDNAKNFNIFGKEIPRQIGNCMDFIVKPDDIESVAEDFFRDVDRERFVDYNHIEVVFKGISDVK